MTFAAEWANRHDGACEARRWSGANDHCHCDHRWLEERLSEALELPLLFPCRWRVGLEEDQSVA